MRRPRQVVSAGCTWAACRARKRDVWRAGPQLGLGLRRTKSSVDSRTRRRWSGQVRSRLLRVGPQRALARRPASLRPRRRGKNGSRLGCGEGRDCSRIRRRNRLRPKRRTRLCTGARRRFRTRPRATLPGNRPGSGLRVLSGEGSCVCSPRRRSEGEGRGRRRDGPVDDDNKFFDDAVRSDLYRPGQRDDGAFGMQHGRCRGSRSGELAAKARKRDCTDRIRPRFRPVGRHLERREPGAPGHISVCPSQGQTGSHLGAYLEDILSVHQTGDLSMNEASREKQSKRRTWAAWQFDLNPRRPSYLLPLVLDLLPSSTCPSSRSVAVPESWSCKAERSEIDQLALRTRTDATRPRSQLRVGAQRAIPSSSVCPVPSTLQDVQGPGNASTIARRSPITTADDRAGNATRPDRDRQL